MSDQIAGSSSQARPLVAPPVRRTRTGCGPCKTRRVKCDEMKPSCGACIRLGLVCQRSLPTHARRGTSSAEAASEPTSRRLSCDACRDAKVKCDRQRPSCSRCKDHGTACVYSRTSVTREDNSIEVNRAVTNLLPEPDIDPHTLALHVEAFFTCVYPNDVFNFIHRGTLEQGIREKTTPRLLLLAICLVSARYVTEPTAEHPSGGPQASAWRRELRMELVDQVGRLSIIDLACLLLLIRHELNIGNYGSGWILFAVAVRIAYGLQINDEGSLRELPWIEQESLRRMMWSCVAMDAFTADGFLEHQLCGAGTIRLQLPCNERNFSFQVPCVTSRLPLFDEPSLDFTIPGAGHIASEGLTSHWIRMVMIRRGVLKYIRTIGLTATDPWEPGSLYYGWRTTLEHFYLQLPVDAAWNPVNMYSRNSAHQLDLLIGIHGWYHQTHCLLHRFVMSGPLEQLQEAQWDVAPLGWRDSVLATCLEHARLLSGLFLHVKAQFPEWMFTNVTAGNLIYASIRHQFHYWVNLGARPMDAVGPEEHLVQAAPQLVQILQDLTRRFLPVQRLLSDVAKMLVALGLHDVVAHLGPLAATNKTDAAIGENYVLHQIRHEESSIRSSPAPGPREESPVTLPIDFDFALDPFGGQDALLFMEHWFALNGAGVEPFEAGFSGGGSSSNG